MTLPAIVLWIYIVLLLAGGLTGFLKAGSKISLITSAAFAIPLVWCALGMPGRMVTAEIILGLLLLVFVVRYAKGRKFMPSGLMAALSLACLAGLYLSAH